MDLREIPASELSSILASMIDDEEAKRAEREMLMSRIAEIDRELDKFDAMKSLLQRYRHGSVDEPPASHNEFDGMSIPQIAYQILCETGMGMKPGTIAQEMIGRGYDGTDSSRLRNSLYMAMSRKPEMFHKGPDGHWWAVPSDPPEEEDPIAPSAVWESEEEE